MIDIYLFKKNDYDDKIVPVNSIIWEIEIIEI